MELGVDTGLDLKFTLLPCLHCNVCHGTSWVRRILCKSHICVATLVIRLWCQISLFLLSPQISWLHYQKGCNSCLLSTLLIAQTICFRGSAFVLSPRSKLFVWSPWFVLIIKFYQDNLLVSGQYSLPQNARFLLWQRLEGNQKGNLLFKLALINEKKPDYVWNIFRSNCARLPCISW